MTCKLGHSINLLNNTYIKTLDVQIKSYNELIQYYVSDLGRVYELITPVKPYQHLPGLWCLTALSTVC